MGQQLSSMDKTIQLIKYKIMYMSWFIYYAAVVGRAAVDITTLNSSRDVQSVTAVGRLCQSGIVPGKKENLHTLCTAGLYAPLVLLSLGRKIVILLMSTWQCCILQNMIRLWWYRLVVKGIHPRLLSIAGVLSM